MDPGADLGEGVSAVIKAWIVAVGMDPAISAMVVDVILLVGSICIALSSSSSSGFVLLLLLLLSFLVLLVLLTRRAPDWR